MTPSDRGLHPPSVVVLVADGARPDTLAAAMDRGDLPALARLRAEGGAYTVTTVFPSVTGPAYAPFLMGRFPGPAGLPGIRWFDRAHERTRWPSWSRSYVGLDYRELSLDIAPDAPTLFELVPNHLAALATIERGLRSTSRVGSGARFAARAALTHFGGDVDGWLTIDRMVGDEFSARLAAESPAFAFCAFTGIDKASHAAGQGSSAALRAMQIVDAAAARIRADAERDGRWGSMHLWIVSDHGHSPMRTHEDLAGFVRSRGVGVRAHPWTLGFRQEAAVMVSGNAMAHIYLDIADRLRPWWRDLSAKWSWLADALLERESTDLVILPVGSGEVEIRSRGRGAARLTCEAGLYSYLPTTGDPLGIGALHGVDESTAYTATIASDYPDGLVQLASLCASPRCGDLIVSAARDWDLRAKWEPIPHVSSHGALHREHMLAPLIVNRPAARAPRRTVDVFASAVDALGVARPASVDGRSWVT